MAEMPDLPESNPGGEYTHEWLARFTDAELAAYREYLVAEIETAVDIEPPISTYRSASYKRYRYRRWVGMIDDEVAHRSTD